MAIMSRAFHTVLVLGHFAYHLMEYHQHNHEISSYQHRPGLRLSVPITTCLMILSKDSLGGNINGCSRYIFTNGSINCS